MTLDYKHSAPTGGSRKVRILFFCFFALTSLPLLLAVAVRYYGTEAALILGRGNERADHAAIVAGIDVVQDIQPEAVTAGLGSRAGS